MNSSAQAIANDLLEQTLNLQFHFEIGFGRQARDDVVKLTS